MTAVSGVDTEPFHCMKRYCIFRAKTPSFHLVADVNFITISQILAWSIVLIGRYDTGTAGPKNPTKPMQRQIQLQIHPSENFGLAHSFVRKMQIQKQIQIQIQIISSDKFGFEHSFDRQMQI